MKITGKTMLLVLVALCALSASVAAVTPNLSITAAKVDAPPTLDGVLDDAAWVVASQLGAKVVVDQAHTGDSIAAFPRVAYVAYTEKALYVAYVAYGANAEALPDLGGHVSSNDEVELFLLPAGQSYDSTANQFIVDSNMNTKNGDFFNAAVGKNTIQWIVEMELPFENLGVAAPKPGDTWTVNFNGHQVTDESIWICWNPTYGGFHNPERFGTLVFGE